MRFEEEYKILDKTKDLQKRVSDYLVEKYDLDNNAKGFKYLVDILTLCLIKKKYTRTFICEIAPFIAHKYGIKEFRVQRQLRYVCTVKTNNKYKVIDIVAKAWFELKTELEQEREKKNENKKIKN